MSNRKHSNRGTTLAALALLVLAIFLYFFWDGDNITNTEAAEFPSLMSSFSIPFEVGVTPKSFSDNNGFYFLTSDGVRRYDNSGRSRWDYPLNFTSPVFVENGGFVGAGELKGNSYYAFNPSGHMYSVDTGQVGSDNSIINFSISAGGFSAVTFSNANQGYNINIYDSLGAFVIQRVEEDKNNYPISTAISDDGRILAVSYLNVSGARMYSYICAYYISGSDGKEFADYMFASFQSTEDEIISRIKFVDDKNLVFMSDKRLGVYEATASNQMKLKWSKSFNNKVAFADIISVRGIAIAFGKAFVNTDGFAEGTFMIYDLNGNILVEHRESNPITYLSLGKDSVIIGSGALGRKFTSISYKNKIIWEYNATSDVYEFIPLNRPERALMIIPGSIEIMERSNQ